MEDSKDLFATVTRRQIRYPSVKGELNTEQLWTVPLRSSDGFNLDEIAKGLDAASSSASKSFVTKQPVTPSRASLALEVVKRIIAVKLAEEEEQETVKRNEARRQRLIEALDQKQVEEVKNLSTEDIQKELERLSQ